MNILSAQGVNNLFNSIFSNWQMLLFILLAVCLLIAIIFRRFKAVKWTVIAAALALLTILIIDLIIEAIKWDLVKLVDVAVRWVPTVLFVTIILIATLLGTARGLRKSLILLAQEVGVAILCIVLYAVCVKLPAVDKFTLNVVNFFMGGSGSLQRLLNVSEECVGIKEVFVEWLPSVLGNTQYSAILSENSAYIYTVADLAYHLVFSTIIFVLFFVLDFILYLLYLFIYPERRHKKKVNVMYAENRTDRRYSKMAVGGTVVGVVRGITIGLLSMAFLGTIFFTVAGRGEGKLSELQTDNEDVGMAYSIYRSIDSYGTKGIFKILNAVSDDEDSPYYLIAADALFSGKLEDEELGISEKVVFRKEISAYTGFANDTLALLVKYCDPSLVDTVMSGNTDAITNAFLSVIKNDDFRLEFREVIADFDSGKYVMNFALSLVNSIVVHIDDIQLAAGLGESNRELLKVLFTDQPCKAIPDENEALKYNLPLSHRSIRINKLLNKNDILLVYDIVTDILCDERPTEELVKGDNLIELIRETVPRIRQLSVLNGSRAEELDPVLCRLYCYAANKYLTAEGATGVTYTALNKEGIGWVSEINSLLDVADDAFTLYGNVYSAQTPAIDIVKKLFDKNDENYQQNIACYDDICYNVEKSRLLGKALSTSFVYNLINNALNQVIDGIYIPDGIVYDSTFDENGNVVEAGEIYNLLSGVAIMGKSTTLLEDLTSLGGTESDTGKLITALKNGIVATDENGKKLSDYAVNSKLIRSLLSAALVKYASQMIYVPEAALEKDSYGNYVNYIKENELTTLFDALDDVADLVEAEDMAGAIIDFMDKDAFTVLLENSTIFEATLAYHLVSTIGNSELIIIPRDLKNDYGGWVTVGGREGELKKLFNSIGALGLEIKDVINNAVGESEVVDKVLSLSEENIDTILSSRVMHYTLSNTLISKGADYGDFSLIVPYAARQNLAGDVIWHLVKKNEIKDLLKLLGGIELNEETDVSTLFVQLIENKALVDESNVIAATIVYALASNQSISDMLKLPAEYKTSATKELLLRYGNSNVWKGELPKLIDALDEIFGISGSEEEFEFDEDKLNDKVNNLINTLTRPATVNSAYTRLRVCYASEIMRSNMTARLDENLEGKVDEIFLRAGKGSDGYYTRGELEALSGALEIFDIDVFQMTDAELETKLKDELMSLNDVAEGYGGKTKLNVVYPSAIISGMLAERLDDALLDSENGGANPLIDAGVLVRLKNGSTYFEEDISQLIAALKSCNIEDFDSLNEDSIGVSTLVDNDNSDDICRSRLTSAILTYQIKHNDNVTFDHPLAYESDIEILKEIEIKSLIELLKDNQIRDIDENFYFDDSIKISTIRDYVCDERGMTKSYLIYAGVSDCLKDYNEIIVPLSLLDSYGCIPVKEIAAVLDAFESTGHGDESIWEWSAAAESSGNGKFEFPDKTQRDKMFASVIMRAKISDQICKANTDDNYIKRSNITRLQCTNGHEHVMFTAAELTALCDAIDITSTSSEAKNNFTIPDINVSNIRTYYDNIPLFYSSDVLRYKICAILIGAHIIPPAEIVEERVFNVGTMENEPEDQQSISLEKVMDAIDLLGRI